MNTIGNTGHTTGPQSRFTRGPSEYREPLAVGIGAESVAGHGESAAGIRASCADPDTYPWRVVGHGDGTWSVVGHNSTVHRSGDCDRAHATAKSFKVLHPEGYVDRLNEAGEPINISGPNHTIPGRLAGLLFTLTNVETGARVQYLANQHQPSPHNIHALSVTQGGVPRTLPVHALAANDRIKVRVNASQFLPATAEAEPEIA